MEYSIFYSWQSDTPDDCNRTFIRKAIDAAIESLQATVNDAPRVESGMEGVAGTPEVATMMFTKIGESAIFIGDMTLVGTVDRPDGVKKVPNPNVLLEMGYAAGTIGWGRIICVMNEEFGKAGELPLDCRNRRFPIDYTLASGDTSRRDQVQKDLTRWIKSAIKTVQGNEYETAKKVRMRLDVNCLNLMQRKGGLHFSEPKPNEVVIGGVLDTATFRAAVTRCLDLGLIEAHQEPVPSPPGVIMTNYAYHWTNLGDQVLRQLLIRK